MPRPVCPLKPRPRKLWTLWLPPCAKLWPAGESVTFTGFGSFKVVERAARKGRNPRTGKEITIPASKVAKFTPGKGLKDAIK